MATTANGESPPKTTDEISPQTLTPLIETLIIDEILPRLPVKSLIRFKSVCKTWKSAISNPHFITSHLKFSSAKHPQLIVEIDKLRVSVSLYYTLPYRELNSIYDLEWLRFRGAKYYDWHGILDSFNGIVCLSSRNCCLFTLWNPATREVRDVAPPEKVVGIAAEAVGFAYVPSVDDYLIVACFEKFLKISSVGTFRGFFVFSVKAGKWESILGTYTEFDKLDGYGSGDTTVKGPAVYAGVVVGDTMYWITELFAGTKFVGFNVVTHEFKEYPLLDSQRGCWTMQLFRVNGCLSLLCNGGPVGIGNEWCNFWMLKDPNDSSSWQRILAVDYNCEFLMVSNSGKCLIQRAKEELRLVVPSKKALKCSRRRAAFKAFPIYYIQDYVESLISPFGGTIEG